MNDEDALVALALGDESDKQRARDYIADVHLGPLVVRLDRLYQEDDVADRAALGAINRLFRVAETTPDRLPRPSSLAAWLLSAARFAARDARRQDRGRQRAEVGSLEDHEEEDLEVYATEFEETVENAEGSELADIVLDYILKLDQPARAILLYDTHKFIQEMTRRELDLHDEEMIDCVRPYGVWTRDALRSHRTRARQDLRDYLSERGYSV